VFLDVAVIMSAVNTFSKEVSSSISYLSVKYRMVCEYVKLLPKFSITDCDWFFQYRAEIFSIYKHKNNACTSNRKKEAIHY
jgi:hypothetical protein